jgi:hypothetical protein
VFIYFTQVFFHSSRLIHLTCLFVSLALIHTTSHRLLGLGISAATHTNLPQDSRLAVVVVVAAVLIFLQLRVVVRPSHPPLLLCLLFVTSSLILFKSCWFIPPHLTVRTHHTFCFAILLNIFA